MWKKITKFVTKQKSDRAQGQRRATPPGVCKERGLWEPQRARGESKGQPCPEAALLYPCVYVYVTLEREH